MKGRLLGNFLAAAALVAIGAGAALAGQPGVPVQEAPRPARRDARLSNYRKTLRNRRCPGLGWSVAEDRRRAKKRRNRIRHRKACKGKR